MWVAGGGLVSQLQVTVTMRRRPLATGRQPPLWHRKPIHSIAAAAAAAVATTAALLLTAAAMDCQTRQLLQPQLVLVARGNSRRAPVQEGAPQPTPHPAPSRQGSWLVAAAAVAAMAPTQQGPALPSEPGRRPVGMTATAAGSTPGARHLLAASEHQDATTWHKRCCPAQPQGAARSS